MESPDMVKGGKFSLRSFVASISKDDPRKCWPFQELIDYHKFWGLEGSTLRSTEVQSKPKGKEVVSENPADEDSDDDIPLGEWLKRKGLKVQASNVALAKPQLADSSSGLKPSSSAFVMTEVMPGVPGAGVQASTMALAEPREREVMVRRVSRNPAELSTEVAKLFLRGL